MAVPAYIRKIARPVNTVVVDSGNGRYAVRERTGVQYVPGGNPQPRNGRVIGHIQEGRYVPLQAEVVDDAIPDMLSYGAAAFARSVSEDLMDELLRAYALKDATTIMAIATLRVIKPEITSGRLSTHYRRTFVSKYYPAVAISPNSVSKFYQNLGMAGDHRRKFYQLRAEAVAADHHVAIDGTL